jgi:thymidylate synthase (FAD)
MNVDYLGHFGDDIMVCNTARVSFDKLASNYTEEQNHKLIGYLAKHNHFSPFTHPQMQVRVTAPIFVAAQLKRHQVGLSINEVSRRYVDDEPTFYIPEKWRGRPPGSIKQGSSDEEIVYLNDPECGMFGDYTLKEEYGHLLEKVGAFYSSLLESGVAPEMARMVLPQSMNTSWIWTGSLLAFIRIYNQRIDSHSQLESQMIAKQLGEILAAHFPVSFKAWTEKPIPQT